MGVIAYLGQTLMGPEVLAALPEDQQALYANNPWWNTAAFAFAVWGGALASVFLLLRKSWAIPTFVVSLVGILVQNFHSFFMSNSWEVFGPGGLAMPIMVIVFAVALVWFSRMSRSRGWIA